MKISFIKKLFLVLIIILFSATFLNGCFKKKNELLLATTTSVYDTGLLDYLLKEFNKEHTVDIKVLAVGSGEALKMGQAKNVDVLIVHAPEREKEFIKKGYGEKRKTIMKNNFVIVGPKGDPAKINNKKTAVEVFKAIKRSKSKFVSRGDDSGTEIKEKEIWRRSKINPKGGNYIKSGQGMGATLLLANDKQAYTISDSATFIKLKRKLDLEVLFDKKIAWINRSKQKEKMELKILFDKSGSKLDNYYSIITIASRNKKDVAKANVDKFYKWIVSKKGKQILRKFKGPNEKTLFEVL